jgi:hypothetical protein
MGSRNVGIPVQVAVHDVLHRIEEQSGCIAWDVYDCVTLEQILSVARKVAAKSQKSSGAGANSTQQRKGNTSHDCLNCGHGAKCGFFLNAGCASWVKACEASPVA